MSAGPSRARHAAWCPALSNRFQQVPAGKGLVRYQPMSEQFDCLCRGGTVDLSDPRREVVEEAAARALLRQDHGDRRVPADAETMEVYRVRARERMRRAGVPS